MSRCQDQRTKPALSRPFPKLQDIGTRFWFMEWRRHDKSWFFDKLFVGHTRIHRIKAGWSWGTRGVGVRWSRWFSCWFWVILAIQENPVCVCVYLQWSSDISSDSKCTSGPELPSMLHRSRSCAGHEGGRASSSRSRTGGPRFIEWQFATIVMFELHRSTHLLLRCFL